MTQQDGNVENVRVFLRVRPPLERELNQGFRECLNLHPAGPTTIEIQSKPKPKRFTFDYVADEAITQEQVFREVGRPITDSCLNGYNGTIFAYGQTGSGKTFTMLGNDDEKSSTLRGLTPRVFEYLFACMARKERMLGDSIKHLCKCSCLEVYNEHLYDLLDPEAKNLNIREDISRGVFIDNLSERVIENNEEAMHFLQVGTQNRRIGETAMNRESSRSHCVFILSIQSTEKKENGLMSTRTSRFNLVDLAGSERQGKTQSTGTRLKEAGQINKSLSCLGNVIMALVQIANGQSRHVPYRDSKLTFLLKDSLGGNAMTFIIANVSPASDNFSETLSTLKFAQRAKFIKNKAKINEDESGSVTALKKENARLHALVKKLKLQMKNGPQGGLSELKEGESRVSVGDALNNCLVSRVSKAQKLINHFERKDSKNTRLVEILRARIVHIKRVLAMKEHEILKELRRITVNGDIESVSSQTIQLQLQSLQKENNELRNCHECPDALYRLIQLEDLEGRFADVVNQLKSFQQTDYPQTDDSQALIQAAVKLDEFTTENNRLKKQLADLSNRMSSPESLLKEMPTPQRQRFQSIEFQKWKASQVFEAEKCSLTEKLENVQDDVKSKVSKIIEYERKLEKSNEMLCALELERDSSEIKYRQALELQQQEYHDMIQKMKENFEKERESLQKRNTMLLNGVKQTTMNSEMQLDQQRNRVRQLESDTEFVDFELKKQQATNEQLRHLIQERETGFQQKEKSIREQLAKFQVQIQTLKSDLLNSTSNLEQARESSKKYKTQIKDLSLENNALTSTIQNTKRKNECAEKSLCVVKEKLEQTNNEVLDLTNQVEKTKREKEQLECEIEKLQDDFEGLQETFKFCTNDLEEAKVTILTLEAKAKEREISLDGAYNTLEEKDEQLVTLQEQLGVLTTKSDSTVKVLRDQNNELQQELASIKCAHQSMCNEANSYRNLHQQKEEEIKDFEKREQELKRNCMDAQEALLKLQTKFQKQSEELKKSEDNIAEGLALIEDRQIEAKIQATAITKLEQQLVSKEMETQEAKQEIENLLETHDLQVCEMSEAIKVSEAQRKQLSCQLDETCLRTKKEELQHEEKIQHLQQTHSSALDAATKKTNDLDIEFQKKQSTFEEQISVLASERSQLLKDLEESHAAYSEAQRQLSVEKESVQEARKRIKEMFGNKEECENRTTGTEDEANRSEVSSLGIILETTRQQFNLMKQQYTEEKDSHADTVAKFQQQIKDIQQHFEEATKKKLQEHAAELQDIVMKLKEKENTISELSDVFEQRKQRFMRVQAGYDAKVTCLAARANSVHAQAELLSKENKNLEEEFKECATKLRDALDRNTGLQDNITDLRIKVKNLEDTVNSVESGENECEALKTELIEKEEKLKLLKESLQRRKSEEQVQYCRANELERKFKESQERIQALSSNATKNETKLQKLNQENARLLGHQNHKQKVRHLETLKRELDSLRTRCAALQKENDKFKRDKSKSHLGSPSRHKNKNHSTSNENHQVQHSPKDVDITSIYLKLQSLKLPEQYLYLKDHKAPLQSKENISDNNIAPADDIHNEIMKIIANYSTVMNSLLEENRKKSREIEELKQIKPHSHTIHSSPVAVRSPSRVNSKLTPQKRLSDDEIVASQPKRCRQSKNEPSFPRTSEMEEKDDENCPTDQQMEIVNEHQK